MDDFTKWCVENDMKPTKKNKGVRWDDRVCRWLRRWPSCKRKVRIDVDGNAEFVGDHLHPPETESYSKGLPLQVMMHIDGLLQTDSRFQPKRSYLSCEDKFEACYQDKPDAISLKKVTKYMRTQKAGMTDKFMQNTRRGMVDFCVENTYEKLFAGLTTAEVMTQHADTLFTWSLSFTPVGGRK